MIDFASLADIELIKKVRESSCTNSMEELINRHKNIYYTVCHKFHKKHPTINLEDILDDIYIVFGRAVDTYKQDKKTKFSTWLHYMSYWHALNSHKDIGKTINFENSDLDKINESNNRHAYFCCPTKETNDYIYNILGQLEDKRIKKIFEMRFLEGGEKNKLLSWSRIAPRLGLSISHTINLWEKGRKFIFSKIKENNYYDNI
jgi:DNA-directed RNA polymerase specialized sigma subunit